MSALRSPVDQIPPARERPAPPAERPEDIVLPLALALARFAARRQREADSKA